MPTRFIELAGEINTSMPNYVVHRVVEALNDAGKPLKGSKICMLGVAYKKDVDDPRESPSFELMELLRAGEAVLSYNDPHVPRLPRMRHHDVPDMQSTPLDAEVPGQPGLRAHRHRSLGLRLRLYRQTFPAGHRHAQRDQKRASGREKIRKA